MKRKLTFDEIDQIKSLDQMKLNRNKAPTVQVVGVNDVDFTVTVDGKDCRQYQLWNNLLKRCYAVKFHEKHPTYIDCSVSFEWVYFSNFLVWCNNQKEFNMKDVKGNSFALDKDITNKGNKIYSSKDCNFVPQAVNNLLTKRDGARGELPIGVCFDRKRQKFKSQITIEGKQNLIGYFATTEAAFEAYKTAKEAECKRIANIYKDLISPIVYTALMTYTVSIDD